MARWKQTEPAPTAGDGNKAMLAWTVGFLTPMFGGGVYLEVDQNKRQQKIPDPITPVRVSAIRGQLRFWWRAAIGSRMASIAGMREREAELFGNAGRRATVEIAVTGNPTTGPESVFEMLQGANGLWNPRPMQQKGALAYGAFPLQPPGSQPQRLEPGVLHRVNGNVTLTVSCRREDSNDMERTVETWLALGGLGGRTRRGFGALRGARWALERVLDVGSGATLPGVPSLLGARVEKKGAENGDDAQRILLNTLRTFRQGVNTGRNHGQQANRPGRSRWPEPDMVRRITGRSDPDHQPAHQVQAFPRGLFGMPIIFHFLSRQDPRDTSLAPQGRERMASPLILRPWQNPADTKCFAVAIVLTDPSRANLQAVLSECGGHREPIRDVDVHLSKEEARGISPLNGDPDPLNAFLNYFKTSSEVKS